MQRELDMTDYHIKPKAERTIALSKEVRDSIDEKYKKRIDFYRDTGLEKQLKSDVFHAIMRGERRSIQEVTMVHSAWMWLNHTTITKKQAEAIIEQCVALVKREYKINIDKVNLIKDLYKHIV